MDHHALAPPDMTKPDALGVNAPGHEDHDKEHRNFPATGAPAQDARELRRMAVFDLVAAGILIVLGGCI